MIDNSNSHSSISSMFAKCFNGRRFSPLMGFLLIALVLYSANILRRIKLQKNLTAAISNSRRKRDVFQDFHNYFNSKDNNDGELEEKIGLYIITPTYPRPEQLPELTRLSQTLMVNI